MNLDKKRGLIFLPLFPTKKALPCNLRQRLGLGRSRDRQILRQQPTARFMTKIFKEKSPPILKAFEFGPKARPHISASPSIKKTLPLSLGRGQG